MKTERRNILLVSLDDAVPCWPYKTAFTEPLQVPNLDRICERATAFRAAYCQAPICGPSRASFMSGRTPHELGIQGNEVNLFDRVDPRETWPYRLKQSGYFCSSGGKVHHRYKPVQRRHHLVLYSDEQKRFSADMHMPPDIAKKRYGGNRGGWASTDPADDGVYHDAQSADSAIAFLESYDRDEPFYREVGFYSPHGPHYTPARFKDMYEPNNFSQPAAWADGFDYNEYAETTMLENPFLKQNDMAWWRHSVRNYFSAFSHGDHHLGRVWDALQASAHAQNTLVIIISDHGFHLGNRNRYRKTTLWEQVAGVTMVIFDPARPRGQMVDDPVALIDLGPTLMDHAGLAPLEDCVGRSLLPYMAGHSQPDRPVPTFYDNNATIRMGDHRIIRYVDGSTQLYDLRTDFWQLRDLGTDHPAHRDMAAALVACCRDYGLRI